MAEANATEPSLIYDGALNTRLDNDVFHARIAARSHHGDTAQANTIGGITFNNGEYPMEVNFAVGYPTTSANVIDNADPANGLVGTPAIQFKLVLGSTSGTGGLTGNYVHYPSYDCLGASYIGASAQTYANDDAWIDVDLRIDFTNQKFYAYVDGVQVGTTTGYSLNATSFGGSVTANELYGYEINHNEYDNSATSSTIGVNYLMLDRVGIVRYLTSPLTNKDRHGETPISKFKLTMANNAFSIANIEIQDDKDDGVAGTASTNYTYNLKSLFSNNDPVDCGMLVFASDEEQRIDRPVWRGIVDKMRVVQNKSSRVINLQVSHNSYILGKQIPMWDVGQLKDGNDEDSSVPYWRADNEGFKSIMNMGTKPLKMLNNKLGFGQANGFQQNANQRLQLGSGMPIQMYNNHDPDHGPNSIEEQYDGSGILGFAQNVYDASGEWTRTDGVGDAVIKTSIMLPAASSVTESDTVTILNSTSHNGSSKSILDIQDITGGLVAYYGDVKSIVGLDSHTYVPDSTKIIYMGRKIPINVRALADIWTRFGDPNLTGPERVNIGYQNFLEDYPNANLADSNTMVIMFDGDPGLKIGQKFLINNLNIDLDKTLTTYNAAANSSPLSGFLRGTHTVSSVSRAKDIYTTSRVGTTYILTPDIYYVVTETPFFSYYEQKYGRITNVGNTLSANKRYYWSKDTGQFSDDAGDIGKAKYRPIHARWMRDLPQSLWFKYHFGVIDYDPLGANATNDITGGYNFTVPGTTITRTVAVTGNCTTAITKGDKVVQIHQVLYDSLVAQQAWAGVAEIRAEGFWTAGPDLGKNAGTQKNTRSRFIWQDLHTSGGNYYMLGCEYIDKSFTAGTGTASRQGTSTAYKDVIFILPLKFADNYNHLWVLWSDMRIDGNADADGGSRKTKFGLISPTPENYRINLHYVDKQGADGTPDKFAELKINDDVLLWDISSTDPVTGAGFSKPANYGVGTSSTAIDSVVLSANSGNIGSHGTAKLLVTKGTHGITSDYVHLFNTLKHDGVHKVLDNATNTLVLDTKYLDTDSGATHGTRMVPINESSGTRYQDWEDKGGAMCIVDASPFFNLNTGSNQGGAYQVSGGTTDLTDYTTGTTGFPALIDNYWAEAISADHNKASTQETHPNAYKVVSDVTALSEDVNRGDCAIFVDNYDIFASSGTGKFIVEESVSGSNERIIGTKYFKWSSKNTTERTGTATITSATLGDSSYGTNDRYTLDFNGIDMTAHGIQAGMMIQNTTTVKNHQIMSVGDGSSGNATDILVINRGNIGSGVSGNYTWTDTDDWKIPKQLGGIWTHETKISDGAKDNPNDILQEINDAYAIQANLNGTIGSNTTFNIKNDPDETTDDYDYEVVTVSSTIYTASQNITRLLMHIEGDIEAPNSGTYYDSDKLRMLWNAGLTKNWNPPTRLTSFYDINNVPITTSMTSDGGTDNNDNYGGIVKAGVKPLLATLKDITKGAGFGTTNNHHTSFSWLSGRDGRIEFRPKFNSGLVFDRTNMIMNTLNTQVSGTITNVRIYYNGNKDFIDYPSATTSSTTNWKTLEFPQIFNKKEAERLAQKEYNASRKTNSSLTIEPSSTSYTEDGATSLVTSKFCDTGRYGYVADPYIALQGKADTVKPTSWTRLGTGGSLFTGMSNAFDGNLGTTGSLYNRWGKAGPHQVNTATGNVTWTNNFYWYGAASVSHAVQVVHVPNHCPLVSEETGEELRIFVTPHENQATADTSIDNTKFNIWLIDYEYSDDRIKAANISGTGGPSSLNNVNRYKRVVVKESGFYELELPRSYWNNSGAEFSPTRKIIVSFNADYCRDLLRHRCGDPASADLYKSANTLPGITAGTSSGNITIGNDYSIFPLGGRMYVEWYMFHGVGSRAMWNAPRIHMVRDFAYTPASYVKLTDAGLGYSDETFAIKDINWNISSGGSENLVLGLAVDESLRTSNITSFLPSNTVNVPTFIPDNPYVPPPSSTPGLDTEPTSISDGPPAGHGLTGWDFRGSNDSINNASSGWFSRQRGRMTDMLNSIGSGETRILGSNRASATPQTNATHAPTTNVNVSGGNAVSSTNGFTFPGVGVVEDGTSPYFSSAFNQTLTTPSNATSDTLELVANATHLATSGIGILTTKITVNNTEYTQTLSVPASIGNQQMTLFSGRVAGAETPNTTVQVEITRVAGSGSDTSSYNSVSISNLALKQSQTSINTSSPTSQLSGV